MSASVRFGIGVALALLAFTPPSKAVEVLGGVDAGFWFVKNNVAGDSRFIDDGINEEFVESRYTLLHFGLKLTANDFYRASFAKRLNGHFRGRTLLNLEKKQYALGSPDRYRLQLDEFNIEATRILPKFDLWFGRQVIYEAGGVEFDGLRGVYSVNEETAIGVYGGLGNNPRTLTGYIGPTYQKNPFTVNLQTAGAYGSYRTNSLRFDMGAGVDLFKGKLDRSTIFGQVYYEINPVWSLSGLARGDIAGLRGLRNLQASIISRPVNKVTNTLSFSRHRAFQYKQSLLSAIDVPSGISDNPVGDEDVNTSSYNTVRNHTMFRVLRRNYVFTAVQFTRRTFDNRNQMKYTVGYRDPTLFATPTDLRMQVDVIDNYRGFATAFDTMLGRDLGNGDWRIEGGGALYAHDRDRYENFDPVAGVRQSEKEYTFRANLFYYGFRSLHWLLNYALHLETDVTNTDQKVQIHEFYLGANYRFR